MFEGETNNSREDERQNSHKSNDTNCLSEETEEKQNKDKKNIKRMCLELVPWPTLPPPLKGMKH